MVDTKNKKYSLFSPFWWLKINETKTRTERTSDFISI